MAPTTAAATNNMPRNRRPLPKNTVAKKRSSRRPSWSRMTPMNHRKAIPANGNQIERQRNLARVGGEPRARRLRIGGDRAPEQSEARQGQQRKDDARDGGGLRGFQSGIGETVDLAHALNSSGGRSNRPKRDQQYRRPPKSRKTRNDAEDGSHLTMETSTHLPSVHPATAS